MNYLKSIIMPFDNFFAYSLAGGTATTPTQPTDPGTDPEPAVPTQWDATTAGTNLTLSNNNLTVTTSGSTATSIKSNKPLTGKNYWEINLGATTGVGHHALGIATASLPLDKYPGFTADSYCYDPYNPRKFNNNVSQPYGSSSTTGDIIGIAFDVDNGTLEYFKNGTSMGVAFSNISTNTYYAAIGHGGSNNTHSSTAKFDNFTYTPPVGYTAIGAEPENPGTGTTA